MLKSYFELEKHQTTWFTEIFAGITTFLTMAYILFVQPAVLSNTPSGEPSGLDAGAVLLATCLASAAATLLMGLWARYPIGLAPGMGQNFFFAGMVAALASAGIENAWQTGLAIVFVAGILFVLVSLFGVRQWLIEAMSPSQRATIAVGIGFFIALIGLKHSGLLQAEPYAIGLDTGNLYSVEVGTFCVAFVVTIFCYVRGIPGSVLAGIVAATIFAAGMGAITFPESSLVSFPEIETPAAFQLDLIGVFSAVCLPYIIILLFMDFFDTTGTLVAVAERAGLMNEEGELERSRPAMMSDALGTVFGAALGTSTVTSYIESATGVEQGGRTGMTAVVIAICFLLALPFSPIIAMVANFPPITAAALVFVGSLMAQAVRNIDWEDVSESIPAFLVIVGIPFTFSIADGLAWGFISYPLAKIFAGKFKETHWFSYLLGILFVAYFLFLRSGQA
ncbi:Adenine permease AdeP [Planctomycetales bacterium 10988]|nr:Adenine permease AdeP [Planctomycetales bacterium 10988]